MKKQSTREVKVLSIRQPYADWLIFGREKWAENRNWKTQYRGELYIHASRWDGPPEETAGNGVVGAIIGKVKLVEVVDLTTAENVIDEFRLLSRVAKKYGLPRQIPNYEHAVGPICFILIDPKPLKRPIPTLGKLNIWTFQMPAM